MFRHRVSRTRITPAQLNTEFKKLNDFKNVSDPLVFKSAKFKLLFGADAEPENPAKFRIVKLLVQLLATTKLRVKLLQHLTHSLALENWEFRETFTFTELSSYVHSNV